MDVMFTTHPKDGPGKYYMVVAEAAEWEQVVEDLSTTVGKSKATDDLIEGLYSWGIGY